MSLLQVQDLAVWQQERCLLRELSFALAAGEGLAIVGESGSGKTQSVLAMLGLLAPGLQARGSVRFAGEELIGADEERLRRVRGAGIGLVLQDALSSLNPYLRIGAQLVEVLMLHRGLGRAAARAQALQLLDAVRLSEAGRRLRQYPHELSGGMRQRVMLALALAGSPRLLIADEPTSALDVTVQAQLIELLAELRRAHRLALLLITHDLSVVAQLCERTLVLYAGEMMESGPSARLLSAPAHPYTQALLRARPRLDVPVQARLSGIAGSLPPPGPPREACVFAPRCALADEDCRCRRPPWQSSAAGAQRCHRVLGPV